MQTLYIQDPRVDPAYFDVVVAPEHDGLEGPNILSMIGSPNQITPTELVANVLSFNDRLADIPMPRVAMLIGGDSNTHKLTKAIHEIHIKAARSILSRGRSLMVTLSRRTPDWVASDYRMLSKGNDNVWFHEGGGRNPYLAFLGAAETILVTEDSTNMLTEACSTGKSVLTLPMEGAAGKFQNLYDRLSKRCHVRPYESGLSTAEYEPLNESARVAALILERLGLSQAA